VKNKGKFKTTEMVADYIYRGEELEKYSPWQMAMEQWKKVKRDVSGLNDNNKVVLFQSDHPQHESHCLVRKVKADRGQLYHKVIVNVIRRQQFVLDKELRQLWLLSLATSWRSHEDITGKSWEEESSISKGKMSVKAMSGLLENELSLMKQKQQKKKENNGVDTVQGATATAKSFGKQNDYSTMVEGEKEVSEVPGVVIGGENGANSVTAAQLAGLIPVTEEAECWYVIGSESELVLSRKEYCELKEKRRREDEEDNEQEVVANMSVQEMGKILEQWYASSRVLPNCNKEHKVAILVCVLSLAASFCKQDVPDFSMVVQGSGGTGKSKTVRVRVRTWDPNHNS